MHAGEPARGMRVLVVGKTRSVAYWTENVVDAFRAAGARTELFSVNERPLAERLRRAAGGGAERRAARALRRHVEARRPDLVFFTHAFWSVPLALYQALHDAARRPRLLGWVGDRFDGGALGKAALLDRVYFTDSSFLASARDLGFPARYAFLPLAANTRVFRPLDAPREPRMLLVANATPHRRALLARVEPGLQLHGKGWEGFKRGSPHHVGRARLPVHDVAQLYNCYLAVLNVINEENLAAGLNQRAFESAACATPVVNDAVGDLPRCFEPGREVLVYRTPEELCALYRRLLAAPAEAARVGRSAHRRVLAEHTYAHRIRTIVRDLAG